MKLILSFLISISVFGQSWELPILFDEGVSFIDPLTYDANNLLLYDGDVGLTTAEWADRTTTNKKLIFANTPIVVDNAINGHDAVRFDGVNQTGTTYNGVTNAFSKAFPITIYAVVKPITWTSGDVLFDGGNNSGTWRVDQIVGTPKVRMRSESSQYPNLSLDTWHIVVVRYDVTLGASLWIDGVLGAEEATVDATSLNFLLATRGTGGANYFNGEFAYVIVRTSADNDATRIKFQQFLANRFGITLP